MNKAELIRRISSYAGLTQKEAGKALTAFQESVVKQLAGGEHITLVGFGSMSVVERKERVGRNPRTGDTLVIPARKAVKFKPGVKLHEAVNAE